MAVKVDERLCAGCGLCAEVCPVEAIRLVDGKAKVNEESCVACETCLRECPREAISAG